MGSLSQSVISLQACGHIAACNSIETLAYLVYVCMYLMIGKGQIAQKDHIGARYDLREKFMGKYKYLVAKYLS